MAGRAGRTYKRDSNGRFASTGGGGKSRPAAKRVSKGTNRLTRDNSGKITSVGGNGATVRGGRLRTAAGNLRATQTKKLKTMQGVSYGKKKPALTKPRREQGEQKFRDKEARFQKSLDKPTRKAGRLAKKFNDPFGAKHAMAVNEGLTILRGNFGKRKNALSPSRVKAIESSIQYSGRKLAVAVAKPKTGKKLKPQEMEFRSLKNNKRIAGGRPGMVGKGGKVKGSSKVLPTTRLSDNSRVPAAQRPGSMTNTLRGTMRALAQADAKRIREIESITGQKLKVPKGGPTSSAANRVKATAAGSKSVAQTMRAGLRELARSDARMTRGLAEIARDATPKLKGGKGISARGKVRPAAAKPKTRKPSAPAVKAAAKPPAPVGKPAVQGKRRIAIQRYRPPATTMKYKEAVPVTNANRPRRDRASAVMQRSVSGRVSFDDMQKLRIKASVAANPTSQMSPRQRTAAIKALAAAELQNKKAEKSYRTGAKAYDIYTNLAGYTQGDGRKKWRRAGQRARSVPGTIRGGANRRASVATPKPAPRRGRSRMWYESKPKRR